MNFPWDDAQDQREAGAHEGVHEHQGNHYWIRRVCTGMRALVEM